MNQKNPQRTNNIHKGEVWHLFSSNKIGPNDCSLTKKSGAQLIPIELAKGLKFKEKGRVRTKAEKTVIKKQDKALPKLSNNIIRQNSKMTE